MSTKKKPVKKAAPVKKSVPVKVKANVETEISALENALETKTSVKTISDEELKQFEVNQTQSTEKTEVTEQVIENTEVTETSSGQATETVLEAPKTEIKPTSLIDQMGNITQEDMNKTEPTGDDFTKDDEHTNFEKRVSDLASGEDFVTNEGATDEEDTPEYRREMSKIKASALVEFFDVIFMVICCAISKDFSESAQKSYTLVLPRKNAIKANVFQIMAFSKKKHNPMGTLVFLIIFSYIPLIITAVMTRMKHKREEQERLRAEEDRKRFANLITPFTVSDTNPYVKPPVHNMPEAEKRGRKPKAEVIQIEKNSGARVKEMKDGTFKNLETGEIYSGGRGRKPKWLKQYIGKIG